MAAFIQKSPDQGSPFTGYLAGQATIESGETATEAIPCGGRSVVRLGVPTIDTGTLTFTVVPYKGATARALEDTAGNAVAVASSTGGFSVTIPELSGCYSFTIIAASQSTDRLFAGPCVGTEPSWG